MAVAEISRDKRTSQTGKAVPIVEVYHYSSTNPMFFITNSLSLVNTLSCNDNYFPSHIVVCLIITTTCVH